MTKKEINDIVSLFNGKKTLTYADFKNSSIKYKISCYSTLSCALIENNPPIIELETMRCPTPDGSSVPYFSSGRLVDMKKRGRSFSPTDIFQLTEYGEDLLYQLKKEERQDRFTIIAAITGVVLSLG